MSSRAFRIGFGWGLPILLAFLLGLSFQGVVDLPWNPDSRKKQQEERLSSAFSVILENYAEPLDGHDLVRAGIEGMVDQLDPNSSYFTESEFEQFRQQAEGEYTGVGMQVEADPDSDYVRVVAPFPGGPASEAGIQVDDLIIAVNETSTESMTLEETVQQVKGPAGTDVTVTIQRNGEEKTYTLTRGEIDRPTVPLWTLLEHGNRKVGYMVIRRVSRKTPAEVEEGLRHLKEAGADSLVLDLRRNTGGLLDETIDIADLFLPGDKPVVTVQASGQKSTHATSSPAVWNAEHPIVILVDGLTASAAEVLSGALRDHGLATLVGQPTYGKDSVQRTFSFTSGEALQITVARYLLPDGESIGPPLLGPKREENGYGLMPEHEVQLADVEEERERRLEIMIDTWNRGSAYSGKEKFEVTPPFDPQFQKALEVLRQNTSDEDS